ncbi:MAG: hypothetical protein J6P09_09825 [Methanobrevibacter sp.]|uniref:hypothetical protein n=1 Tax=Methanobrevibacter sp. TaxID=66852 RepID=UPI001B111CC7|nr:hypothetical protein [Methanobrevibacter sp.]MBO6124123.1 hypothetical protein [Methanobrevibacter sp.]MBP3791365.1 hypothetical protein [Methanobrevibacter sp.]
MASHQFKNNQCECSCHAPLNDDVQHNCNPKFPLDAHKHSNFLIIAVFKYYFIV